MHLGIAPSASLQLHGLQGSLFSYPGVLGYARAISAWLQPFIFSSPAMWTVSGWMALDPEMPGSSDPTQLK